MNNQPVVAFLSYSHQDDSFRKAFIEHVHPLCADTQLQVWDDTNLLAGDCKDSGIENALEQCDIFIALVSSAYLASTPCTTEMDRALERMKESQTPRIVPIIVRNCQWKSSVTGDYIALPKDGKAVNTWQREDDAWASIVEALWPVTTEVRDSQDSTIRTVTEPENARPQIRSETLRELDDLGITLQHSLKDFVTLSDVFVYPDLRQLTTDYEDIEKDLCSDRLLDISKEEGDILVLGDEQSGKTTLSRQLLLYAVDQGKNAVLLDGGRLTNTRPNQAIEDSIARIFEIDENSKKSVESIASSLDIIIVDDIDESPVNERHLKTLLDRLKGSADRLIAFSDSKLRFAESRYVLYKNFQQYEVLHFGHRKRAELIDKWNSLGQEETIDLGYLERLNDDSKKHVNSIVRRNIVPPKPLFILTILQSLETRKPTEIGLSSYGHCYQYLVYQAFERANIPRKKTDMYLNYLTELAHWIFRSDNRPLSSEELREFQRQYTKRYVHDDHDSMIDTLVAASLLRRRVSGVGFNYKYILYFFVAKYIAENIEDPVVKAEFEQLFDRIHVERNANVIIFVTHHTKSRYVVEQIEYKAISVFQSKTKATLFAPETAHFQEFIQQIPELVIEERNVERERRRSLENQDRAERKRIADGEADDDDGDDANASAFIADVNGAIRITEIMGQVLRTRYGSLNRDSLDEFAEEAVGAGLRFLRAMLETTDIAKEHIIQHIAEYLDKNDLELTERVEKEAKKLFLAYCYSVIYGWLRKMGHSLGSEQVNQVLRNIEKRENTPAVKLLNMIAEFEFEGKMPKGRIEELSAEFEDNPVAYRMLRQAAVQHLYLHRVEVREKQWIADKLKIPVKAQTAIEARSKSQT